MSIPTLSPARKPKAPSSPAVVAATSTAGNSNKRVLFILGGSAIVVMFAFLSGFAIGGTIFYGVGKKTGQETAVAPPQKNIEAVNPVQMGIHNGSKPTNGFIASNFDIAHEIKDNTFTGDTELLVTLKDKRKLKESFYLELTDPKGKKTRLDHQAQSAATHTASCNLYGPGLYKLAVRSYESEEMLDSPKEIRITTGSFGKISPQRP